MITVELEKQTFEELCLWNDFNFKVKSVRVPDYPYHNDEKWKKQKDISNKAFQKLRNIEYQIRKNEKL